MILEPYEHSWQDAASIPGTVRAIWTRHENTGRHFTPNLMNITTSMKFNMVTATILSFFYQNAKYPLVNKAEDTGN